MYNPTLSSRRRPSGRGRNRPASGLVGEGESPEIKFWPGPGSFRELCVFPKLIKIAQLVAPVSIRCRLDSLACMSLQRAYMVSFKNSKSPQLILVRLVERCNGEHTNEHTTGSFCAEDGSD